MFGFLPTLAIPIRTRYLNTQTLEWYDLVARTGQCYLDIRGELNEIHDYLKDVLSDYRDQCRELEHVNTLLQVGDYVLAKQLLGRMRRVFTVVDYAKYDQAVEEPFNLLKRAQDLEARLKNIQGSIKKYLTTGRTKHRLFQEYYELSRTAETLPDCELRTELVQKLTSVKKLGGGF